MFQSRIRIKELKYFLPRNCFYALGNMIRDVHPGSGLRFFSHPGSRGQKALDLDSHLRPVAHTHGNQYNKRRCLASQMSHNMLPECVAGPWIFRYVCLFLDCITFETVHVDLDRKQVGVMTSCTSTLFMLIFYDVSMCFLVLAILSIWPVTKKNSLIPDRRGYSQLRHRVVVPARQAT